MLGNTKTITATIRQLIVIVFLHMAARLWNSPLKNGVDHTPVLTRNCTYFAIRGLTWL
jgi:hypothetical protein